MTNTDASLHSAVEPWAMTQQSIKIREKPLFDKSLILYGFQGARTVMRKKSRAIIAEGCAGCPPALELRLHRICGVPWHSVDPSPITSNFKFLHQPFTCSSTVIKQAEGATLRTVTHALEVPNLQVKVVRLPEKEDPDTYLRENGPDALEKLLDEATDLFAFAINNKLTNAHGLAIPEMVRKEISPWL